MAFTQISGNGLKNNSITNAHLHSGAAIDGTKIDPDFGTQNILSTGQLQITAQIPANFKRSATGTNSVTVLIGNNTQTYALEASSSGFSINDYTNVNTTRFSIDGSKIVSSLNHDFSDGIDVTGNITVSGTVDGRDLATDGTKLDGIAANATNVTNYVTNDASDTLTGGTYTFSNSEAQKIILSGATNPYIRFQEGTTNKAYIQWVSGGIFQLVNQESGENLRIGSGNFGLQYTVDGTARNVIHSGNVSSYAVPVGGGTMTGDLTINGNSFLRIGDGAGQERILIQKADNNQSDHIIFYNGTTRVGEIGVEDGSWLRLNQESNANVYTPRVFRADGGFQVNGSTVVDSNKNLTVPANADLNLANGTWTGNHAKIQHHNNTVYIVGGTNGIILREGGANRWLIDGSGHLYPGINNYYDFGAVNNIVRDIYCSTVFLGQSTRYLSNVNGDYGSVQINGGGAGGYEGFSIDGRVVFMHSGGSDAGIYNDVNNEWMLYTGLNSTSILYFNGAQRVRTEDYGCRIAGTIRPNSTNGGDCGASDARWGTVYASNGSINTSDRNEKNTIIDSDLGLNFINKLKAVSYKWNDEEIGEKTHYGLVAQDIEETIKEIGKDVDNIGMIDKPEKGAMGLNYNELIAPLVKAIQELSAKVAALEAT